MSKTKTMSKKQVESDIVVEEMKEEEDSVEVTTSPAFFDEIVLEEKTTIFVEETKKVVNKDVEEIKRLREKLNNSTISDGEAAILFSLFNS